MNHYYYGGAEDGLYGFMMGMGAAGVALCVVLGICAIIAYFLAINALVKVAKDKHTELGGGLMWFIGIFATPIVLALIVIAMPDRAPRDPVQVTLPPTSNS